MYKRNDSFINITETILNKNSPKCPSKFSFCPSFSTGVGDLNINLHVRAMTLDSTGEIVGALSDRGLPSVGS